MAQTYADKGFLFLFVYVREAHPGEPSGPHGTMEEKLARARTFRERLAIARPILVDDLPGTAHHLYGLLPNMTYVIARGGRILFRSDWTDPPTLELLLTYYLNTREQRRAGARLTPFYAEFAGYRVNDRQHFVERLKLAGPQAVDDYLRMAQVWAQQAPPEE
jgi:hypothetical protein